MSGELQLQLGQELEKSRMKSSRMSVSSGTRAVRLRGLSVALLLLWTCVCADCTDYHITAVAGETAVLPCHCPSLQPLFLLWQKDYGRRRQIIVEHYREDDGTKDQFRAEYRDRAELRLSRDCALLLHNVNPSDQGQYYCIYQRRPQRYNSIYLKVKDCTDHRVSAVAGETAVLPCQCPSDQPLLWRRDDGRQLLFVRYYREDDSTKYQFRAEYRYRAKLRSGDCAVLLHNVNPSDQGQYHCIYQKEPLRCNIIYLEVKVPPSPPICKIEGVAEYYEDIKLTCRSSEGRPAPTYRWQRHDSNNVPRPIPPRATDQNGVLSLYSITKEMSGFYICTSTNEIRSEKCNLILAVMPQPPSPPICKIEGVAEYYEDIKLTCRSSEGKPAPTYRWQRHDSNNVPRPIPPKATDQNGVLSLYSITKEMSGFYICTSTNEIRSEKCNLILAVMPQPPSPPICKIEGVAEYYEDIKLTCRSSEGKPAPTYRWQRHDSNNVPRPIPPKATDQNGVLSLYSITKEMSGFYICTSTNEIRSETCNLTLAVIPLPPSPPICKIEGVAEYYEDIKLTCRSSEGTPAPTYRWQSYDTNNVPRLFLSRATDQNGVLSLYSITKEMSGFYICTSTNEIRSETCNLTLAVMPRKRIREVQRVNICLKL